MPEITVNAERMLRDLQFLRSFGASGKGVARQAFSDEDIASRRWLASRMTEAGLKAVVDLCGNLFGLPPGDGPFLLVGSHSDTQPLGGWLDGAYGVICGLEIARAAMEAGRSDIAVVSFQDEEGRFGGLTGSDIWSGRMSLADADQLEDGDGLSFGDARRRAGEIAPMGEVSPRLFNAYLEAHIEQGPVLDLTGKSIGVVESIVGIRQTVVTFEGQANHAGTTPMHMRKDAVRATAAFMQDLDAVFAGIVTPSTVWTYGRIVVDPNASSIVPGRVQLTVQMRDAEVQRLDTMLSATKDVARAVGERLGLGVTFVDSIAFEPVKMDRALYDRLAQAAQRATNGEWQSMPSGALHDSSNVSAAGIPSAMLFVPSIGGISHNPNEDTPVEHLELGLSIMAEAVATLQGVAMHN